MKIYFSHLSPEYKKLNLPYQNGAYWYSVELCENILPKIKTNRRAVTINMDGYCEDNAIVFIHNNDNPYRYDWLGKYKSLILVCSKYETLASVIEILPKAHVIYLPLSIDTDYVKQFKAKRKYNKACFMGRLCKKPEELPDETEIYGNLPREELLKKVAKCKTVYATARCLLEAKCLGCNAIETGIQHGSEELLDNKDVIPMLQKLINEIDQVKG